jgi:hypothetical protein
MKKHRIKPSQKQRQKQAGKQLTHAADTARMGYYLAKLGDWIYDLFNR